MRGNSSQLQLKNLNRRCVLNFMRSNENVTKAGMANVTGLTFMAIKKIIAELESLSLIRDDRYETGKGAGRRALSYTINEKYGYVIGLHINRFVTRAAVMDLKGQLISLVKQDMENKLEDQSKLMEMIFYLIEEAVRQSGADPGKIIGIGAGVPGPVDMKNGVVLSPPNFPALSYLPLGDILKQKFRYPVLLQKDTNAMAMGEYWNGAGRGVSNLVYIDLDMGIGSGIVLDGKIHCGASQTAGELGHITVEPEGELCSCGNRGCLEVLSSCPAIVRQFKEKLKDQPGHPLFGKLPGITVKDVLRAGEANDVLALSILNRAAFYTGTAVSSLVNLLDPQMIVMGGILIEENSRYGETIKNIVAQRKIKSARNNEIVVSSLKDRAGVIGAGEVVIDNFFQELVNIVLSKEES